MAQLGNDYAAAIAFNRFGLGGRPDDALPPDPNAYLLTQLQGADGMPQNGLPTRTQCLQQIELFLTSRDGSSQRQRAINAINAIYSAEVQAALTYAVTTEAPFRERLVWFWANHFALLTAQSVPQALAGVFVREAIRPYVTGNFTDMLLAVMTHPGMIYSLNNDTSVGPDSQYAQEKLKRGIHLGFNENLARECLELHTLGINGGYSQADVDALANILTGWTVVPTTQQGFYYNASWHEPTPQTLLGTQYPPTYAGGVQALTDLSTNQATYAHLASELVQHFVSDTPDPNDVATVQAVLQNSGGDLSQAAAAVVGLSNAWATPLVKFRNPRDHVIAVLRAVGTTANTMPASLDLTMQRLGEPTWNPPLPNGWSDLQADWLCPAQMVVRTDWAGSFTAGISGLDPIAIAGSSVGPYLAPLTQQLIGQLPTLAEQFQLLFCSPEFQRR